MRSRVFRITFLIAALALSSFTSAPAAIARVQDPAAEIVLPEGTPINVVTAQEVTSKQPSQTTR